MNIKFRTTLLAALVMSGFSFAQENQATQTALSNKVQAETLSTDSCCSSGTTSTCTIQKPCSHDMACEKGNMKKCCASILTKEERHRFCCAKAAVIAANPALGGKGHKKELCDAICKEDPSMKPIMEKLKKHCEEMHHKKNPVPTTPAS